MVLIQPKTNLLIVAGVALVVLFINWLIASTGPVVLPKWVIWHSMLEGVSVVVASLIFAIGQSAPTEAKSTRMRVLAFAFLGVALLDGLHLLTYGGMPGIWTRDIWHRNLFFWLSARLLSALALLVIAVKTEWPEWRAGYATVATALVLALTAAVLWLAMAHPGVVPILFAEGAGLSPLKIGLEWFVVALNVITVAVLLRRSRTILELDTSLLTLAVSLMIISELCFTVFVSMGDVNNVLGHLIKTGAFVVLYRAVFVATVRAPYAALQASEHELRESRAQVDGAFSESMHPKVLEALDGSYVRVNAAFASLLGRSERWFRDRNWEDVTLPEDRDDIRAVRAMLVSGEVEIVQRERRLLHADGTLRWVSKQRRRLSAASGSTPLILVEMQDITARKQAEAELAASADALRHSQKTEAMGRLAGGIAHDFNNLLTAIFASATLLEDEVAGNATANEEIAEITAAARRGAAMTQQLLAFSRPQPTLPTTLELGGLVDAFAPVLRRLCGGDVGLEVRHSADALSVNVDSSQLEQVVLNLVINARDAVIGNGVVRVSTEMREVREPIVGPLTTVPAGRWAVLVVQDNGVGMTPEVQARMCEPFFSTKAPGKGTGLGLSTVRGIVEQHGGVLQVDSEVGRGSTFRIHLPLAAD